MKTLFSTANNRPKKQPKFMAILAASGRDGVHMSQRDFQGVLKGLDALRDDVPVTAFANGPPGHTGFFHTDTMTGLMGSLRSHRRHHANRARTR